MAKSSTFLYWIFLTLLFHTFPLAYCSLHLQGWTVLQILMIFLSKLCCFTTLLIYHVVEKWKEPLNISISLGDSEFSETFACNITARSSFPENCTIFNWCRSTLAGKQNERCQGQWGRLILLKSEILYFLRLACSWFQSYSIQPKDARCEVTDAQIHMNRLKTE